MTSPEFEMPEQDVETDHIMDWSDEEFFDFYSEPETEEAEV